MMMSMEPTALSDTWVHGGIKDVIRAILMVYMRVDAHQVSALEWYGDQLEVSTTPLLEQK